MFHYESIEMVGIFGSINFDRYCLKLVFATCDVFVVSLLCLVKNIFDTDVGIDGAGETPNIEKGIGDKISPTIYGRCAYFGVNRELRRVEEIRKTNVGESSKSKTTYAWPRLYLRCLHQNCMFQHSRITTYFVINNIISSRSSNNGI